MIKLYGVIVPEKTNLYMDSVDRSRHLGWAKWCQFIFNLPKVWSYTDMEQEGISPSGQKIVFIPEPGQVNKFRATAEEEKFPPNWNGDIDHFIDFWMELSQKQFAKTKWSTTQILLGEYSSVESVKTAYKRYKKLGTYQDFKITPKKYSSEIIV